MVRLLVIWVDALVLEAPDGSTWRDYLTLFEALELLCPFTEPVRLGLFALPVRAPSRFFGGEDAVLKVVGQTVRDVTGHEARLGVADGLFCAERAARQGVVVAPGQSEAFRRAQPLSTLGRSDLATTGRRLGLHTVGSFADLSSARVLERFDARIVVLHRVARGELGELAGQRDARMGERLARVRGDVRGTDVQQGFFGQRGANDERAAAAAHRIRRRLGASEVCVGALRAGRAPEDRAVLVPWGSPESPPDRGAPWPGRLRAPVPATTFAHPVAIELRDAEDRPVRVGARGLLSAAPVSLLFSARTRREVTWYAGPWLTLERWWSAPRRRAHLQVVLASGEALLAVAESSRWWLVGLYD